MSVVYQHRRLDTNTVFYVGIGKSEKRAYSRYHRNRHWHGIVKKTDYAVEILLDSVTWEEACEQERFLIEQIGRHDLGLGTLVNQTDGGDGGINPSIEARQKRSNSLTGNQNGKGNKGKPSSMTGKKHKDSTKQKMRDKAFGKPKSPTHTKNISLASPYKKACCIDGVVYHSASEAARQLSLNKQTVHNRLHNNKFTNYSYL